MSKFLKVLKRRAKDFVREYVVLLWIFAALLMVIGFFLILRDNDPIVTWIIFLSSIAVTLLFTMIAIFLRKL